MTAKKDVARLRRGVLFIGAAATFFVISAVAHLMVVGSVRWIDLVLVPVGLLFASYLQRYRRAKADAEPPE